MKTHPSSPRCAVLAVIVALCGALAGCGGGGAAAGAGPFSRRPCRRSGRVVELRPRCAAHGAGQRRDAGARSHPLEDTGRPRAAVQRQWRAADPLRFAGDHVAEHGAVAGQDGRHGWLPVRGALRRDRRAALVRRQRLHPPEPQLDAELQSRPHRRKPRLCAGGGRQALLPRRRRFGYGIDGDRRLLRRRCLRRRAGRIRRARSSSTRRSPSTPQGNVYFGFIATGANPAGLDQRHCADRRRRPRRVGRGQRGERQSRVRQGRDEQCACAVAGPAHAVRGGQHESRCRRPARPAPCWRSTAPRSPPGRACRCAIRPPAPRPGSATTHVVAHGRARRRRVLSASSNPTRRRTTSAAGCCTSMRR